MPSDDYIINKDREIREELKEIEINKSDACVSKMPTKEIRLFKDALSAHYEKARTTGEYKREFELMIRRYETFILQDEIQSTNDSNAVVKYYKRFKESIL